MRVAVTGGTGFLGRHLVRALMARGDAVTILSRHGGRPNSELAPIRSREPVRVVRWDPTAQLDASDALDALGACDAVVNLAGAPVVGQRWTPEVKRRVRESRVTSTQVLVGALTRAVSRPMSLVSASAVGYYGARGGNELLDEEAAPGHGFLASVCQDWEDAAEGATSLGVRVVRARIGVVMGPDGGALAEMVKPFKLYAGGPIGSGRQVISWIHLDDAVRCLIQCLDDERLLGPVNLTAPGPVTNAGFARELGRVLHRPSWVSVPAVALRLRFGEGAEPLVTGQRVLPRRLQGVGYQWRFPDVRSALADLLG